MKVIGITGPTGAGKTTVLHVLKDLGAEILDADRVYHQLLRENTKLKAELVDTFGTDILNNRGEVDRPSLAQAVYPDKLQILNEITHPYIIAEIEQRISCCQQNGCKVVAIDAIALIESGLHRRCDYVIAVLAPLETRIRRIMARDGIDEAYARRRALAQKDDAFFRANSDYQLENSDFSSAEAFEVTARKLLSDLLGESK